MKTGLITHYDLDAATSAIMLHKMFDVNENFKCGGYGKLDGYIDFMVERGVERIIFADVSLTQFQFDKVAKLFKHIIVFDHHESSQYVKEQMLKNAHLYPGVTFEPVIDFTKSTAALIMEYAMTHDEFKFMRFVKSGPMLELVLATNAYDTWMPPHKSFKTGYDLTVLFFKYGMWDFIAEFEDGLRPYNEEETAHLADYYSKRDNAVLRAQKFEIASESVCFVCEGQEFINDFALSIHGYATYHMLRKDAKTGKVSLSSRVPYEKRGQGYDLNAAFDYLRLKHSAELSFIDNGGGHIESIGVQFRPDTEFEKIVTFVENLAERTEQFQRESAAIPF